MTLRRRLGGGRGVAARAAGRRRVLSSVANVFDLRAKGEQRRRAFSRADSAQFDYLREEVARRVVDRLDDITREFPTVLDVGCGPGALRRHLPGRKGVRRIVQVDPSREALYRDVEGEPREVEAEAGVRCELVHADLEAPLPLETGSVDLAVSCMSAHWVNDLPGLFREVRRVLRPDGAFLCAMLGGETLQELRSAMAVADQERTGGVAPHVSPFARVRDAGGLLSGAGFTLPSVDFDTIVCRYPDMFTLAAHLQGMGDSNAGLSRAPAVPRDVFLAAAAAYESMYADEEGLVPATFQVLHLIGWAPDKSQPLPKERGSAARSLAEGLGVSDDSGPNK